MTERVVPMIHVPDVRAAVDWYESIGFIVKNTYGNDEGGLSFAIVSFGTTDVMFNQGGKPSTSFRREVDLYVYTTNVDDVYQQLKDRVEVVEPPTDKFYGMRELIIRDLNRFWVTFGQPSAFELLMSAVLENNVDVVRKELGGGQVKSETLTAALALASGNKEMTELLKEAGAVLPAEVHDETLESYVGTYGGEHGFALNVTFDNGKLLAAVGAEQPLKLFAIDAFSFRPLAFDNYGTLTFKVEDGRTVGCVVKHDSGENFLRRG